MRPWARCSGGVRARAVAACGPVAVRGRRQTCLLRRRCSLSLQLLHRGPVVSVRDVEGPKLGKPVRCHRRRRLRGGEELELRRVGLQARLCEPRKQEPQRPRVIAWLELPVLPSCPEDEPRGAHDVDVVLDGRELDPRIVGHRGLHRRVNGRREDDGAEGRALGAADIEGLEELEPVVKATGVDIRREARVRPCSLGQGH